MGGEYLIPKGIDTASWYWNEKEGKLYTKKLNNVLYFLESPVNILSANSLSESMKDDYVTWVLTKREYSIFTWYFGRYKKKISHSENFLP